MEYELWLYKDDGRLSVVMKVRAEGNAQAKHRARELLSGDIRRISIWCEGVWVDSVTRPNSAEPDLDSANPQSR